MSLHSPVSKAANSEGTLRYPSLPYIEDDQFARHGSQDITFRAPYMTESVEELHPVNCENKEKGRNAAEASNDVAATSSILVSNQRSSTNSAAVAPTNGVLSASMELSAKPSTSASTTDMSTLDTQAFVSMPASGVPTSSNPAISMRATSTLSVSTSSGHTLSETTSLAIRPSENTSAARMQYSQGWKRAAVRRLEDVRDATHAARETPSVNTVVDLGSESESDHDSSEYLDDERHSDDERRSNPEEHLDGESHKSEQSTLDHESPKRSWLSGDDLLVHHVVDGIIDILTGPEMLIRLLKTTKIQRDAYGQNKWRCVCEPLDNIYNLLNTKLGLSSVDGITYEKFATKPQETRRLFVEACQKMDGPDRHGFAELLRDLCPSLVSHRGHV